MARTDFKCVDPPTARTSGRRIGYAWGTYFKAGGFMDDPVDNKPPSFWQMLHSVDGSCIRVQSGKIA
jgi:hypothetical protein